MLKKNITFTDLDGVQQTETHYFHFTEADIIKMELEEEGGLSNKLERMGTEGNPKEMLQFVEELISKAYGRRPEGSKRFIKSPEISAEFMSSEAYSALFLELVTNAEAATNFIVGLVPSHRLNDIRAEMDKRGLSLPSDIEEKGKEVVQDLNREGSNEQPAEKVQPTAKTPEQLQKEAIDEIASKLTPEQLKMISQMPMNPQN